MDGSDTMIGDQSVSTRSSSAGIDQDPRTNTSRDADQYDSDNLSSTKHCKSSRRSQPSTMAPPQAPTVGKIRHLKKEDGEPLWRKDIQHDFLRAIFDDQRAVFTNAYEPMPPQTFADLYIDTMSRSSKTSKVLCDKLRSDREAAKSMAMVCLLVNVGRMNTTLNFFPEMRAQLRTYHAIPSLQAHQDASAYKQLQDAPRLKSILKGAAEDRGSGDLKGLQDFKDVMIPRANPVALIFLICQQAASVAELHFPRDSEFHDLIMKHEYTSQSRANAFLWLMWQYLESDFTEEGCEENPFGSGVDYGTDVANQGIPTLVRMTPEEAERENIDTPEEIEFGRAKQELRARIIAADQVYVQETAPAKARGTKSKLLAEESPVAAILPRIRPVKNDSDMDSTRSTPQRALARVGVQSTARRIAGPLKNQMADTSTPSPHPIDGIMPRKPRPPTAHQLAVERNRHQRVEHILNRGRQLEHSLARRRRQREGAILRAKHRLDAMEDPFANSDEEGYRPYTAKDHPPSIAFRTRGFGGLDHLVGETDDYGEQFDAYAAAIRRTTRRLERWAKLPPGSGVMPTTRKPRPASPERSPEPDDEAEEDRPEARAMNGTLDADVAMEDAADELDDMEKELLGLADEDDDKDDDEELDDVDRTLLGLAGDSDDSD